MKNMANKYIIYQEHDAEDTLALDAFKSVKKGSFDDMGRIYRDLFAKSKKLVELGLATALKEFYDEDGTLWFRLNRDGRVMKVFICDSERAQALTI